MTDLMIIETPELVRINLQPAGWGRRFAAFLVDLVLLSLVGGLSAGLALRFLPAGIGSAVAIVVQFVVIWGYHSWFELRQDGQTPGKRMWQLRVVDQRGLPLSISQSLIRNIVRLLDLLPFAGGLGAVCMLADQHRRRLGDLAGGTVVVTEHIQRRHRQLGQLDRRHNSLDTPRIRRLLRQRVDLRHRAFLEQLVLRAAALDDAARQQLMQQAAAHFRQLLELPQDAGMSDENLLRGLAALI